MKTKSLKPELLFRALADKTRLRILNLLQAGELCVCDLVSVLEVPQPTASRHLAYLRRTNLVLARKEGTWAYYQLAPAITDFEAALRKCIECCGEIPQLANDLRRLKTNVRNCCD